MNLRSKYSPIEIECQISKLLKRLGIERDEQLRPTDILLRMREKLKDFQLVILPDAELRGRYATSNYKGKIIKIADTVWLRAKQGNPRDNFTLAEEIGHFALGHPGELNRTISTDHSARHSAQVGMYEREAREFAAALIAPWNLARHCNSASELQFKFSLSATAARIRFGEVQRQSRKEANELRPLPVQEADYILEEARRGKKFRRVDLTEIQRQLALQQQISKTETMARETRRCPQCENFSLIRSGKLVFCDACGWPPGADGELF